MTPMCPAAPCDWLDRMVSWILLHLGAVWENRAASAPTARGTAPPAGTRTAAAAQTTSTIPFIAHGPPLFFHPIMRDGPVWLHQLHQCASRRTLGMPADQAPTARSAGRQTLQGR